MTFDIEANIELIQGQLVEMDEKVDRLLSILTDINLSAITGDASDHSNRMPEQDTPLPPDGTPNCSVHATAMRGPKKSKKGQSYWHCPRIGDAHAGEPVNEKGYCSVLAFLNDDNTIRYWVPPED